MLVSYSIGLKFFYISGLNKMHADTHLKKWSIHMNIEFSKRADRFGSNIFNILNQKKNDRLAQGITSTHLVILMNCLTLYANGTNAVTTPLSHLMKSPLYSEPRKAWLILPLLYAIREIYA